MNPISSYPVAAKAPFTSSSRSTPGFSRPWGVSSAEYAGYELIRKLLKEYDPTNEESTFANENKGRMVFGMNLSDEDKRKYTKGMEYFDWVLEEVAWARIDELLSCGSLAVDSGQGRYYDTVVFSVESHA